MFHRCGAFLSLLLVGLVLTGCGGSDVEPLETFEARWHENVNARRGAGLFDMLDGNSQRKLEHDLQTLRGLPADQQAAAIQQLGGKQLASLSELKTDEYFALLWSRATNGELPRMQIEASGTANAYMVLTMNDGRNERIALIAQGGQWRWRLPEQNFAEMPDGTPMSDGPASEDAVRDATEGTTENSTEANEQQ